jgi:hypothetical protein
MAATRSGAEVALDLGEAVAVLDRTLDENYVGLPADPDF